MFLHRKTAILQFVLPSTAPEEMLPLTHERDYGVLLRIEGLEYPARSFRSPCNDEQWRDFNRRLRECNSRRGEGCYRNAVFIRTIGRDLHEGLADLCPQLRNFLREKGVPRRLVIQTARPELHALPWGALCDIEEGLLLLAHGDLSIVQAWDGFSELPEVAGERLNLVAQLREDTQKATAQSLKGLPPEIELSATLDPDILHVEAHGDAVRTEIGEVGAWKMAQKFGKPKIALLWSCYSAAINSWGESPALCLHRLESKFVLSFQAELHNEDARSIADSFYRDVFGPAASRDPESAIVRIRCAKFEKDFENTNWASMTLYLRCPLDLSALPLNGPRVPTSLWIADGDESTWAELSKLVNELSPGTQTALAAPNQEIGMLPKSVFRNWKGTVIRLDGSRVPLPDSVIDELALSKNEAPKSHPADRLVWFLGKIARYGAPLIVWSNALPQHLDYLRTIGSSPALTFLLLYGPDRKPDVIDLVDKNLLEEARKACNQQVEGDDEYFSAAYFAFARGECSKEARFYLDRLRSDCEKLLLSGNFVSRFGFIPDETNRVVEGLAKRQCEEDYYRGALTEAIKEKNLRDVGRAKLELGYFLKTQGEFFAADNFYRAALESLEVAQERDTRWHSALARVLRDRADLLASQSQRLEEASILLRRALAIHSFHGRALQLAYCRTTGARIALVEGRHADAVRDAVDAANMFEGCEVWRGWGEPVEILLNALTETRQTKLMSAVTDLAIEKLDKKSNLPPQRRSQLEALFRLRKAQGLWIAGSFAEARAELLSLPTFQDAKLRTEVNRLRQFLQL